jgi:cytoskeletal protein RodZ
MVAVQSSTSKTPTVGQRLRLRREEQKRTVAELSAETCITSRYLEAIEADDQKPLPGFFFYRNYVKQYARALGLDGNELYRELASAAPPDPDVLNALSTNYSPKRTPIVRSMARRWIGLGFAAVALAFVTAGYTVAARAARETTAHPIATVKITTHTPATAHP